MTAEKKHLIVVGSPRGLKSVSHSLAIYLADRLEGLRCPAEIRYVMPADLTSDRRASFRKALDEAAQATFIFPLYADQLPATLVEVLEDYAAHRKGVRDEELRGLSAIVNCGFPESFHNETALGVMRLFASTQGFRWLGGLSFGGGGAIEPGASLDTMGGRAWHVRQALTLSAKDLSQGKPLSDEAIRIARKPAMPAWLYLTFGNLNWWVGALKSGAFARMKEKPYKDEEVKFIKAGK